jgi:pentatricopeptide repeat protein
MQRKGLEPYVTTFSALIIACAKGDYVYKALLPLAEMQRQGLEPNVSTYSALIMPVRRVTLQRRPCSAG